MYAAADFNKIFNILHYFKSFYPLYSSFSVVVGICIIPPTEYLLFESFLLVSAFL